VINKDDIIKQATWELNLEEFEKQVAIEKQRILSKKSLLDSIFPWTITIKRKK